MLMNRLEEKFPVDTVERSGDRLPIAGISPVQ
jgi:hypothetical protein